MEIKKAQKRKVKLKIGMSGASGFGKTYSALLLAYGMVNDWSKIVVIDTENRSASLYSDLGEYSTLELAAPFTPERYIEAIKECEKAGFEVIIVDSITHEWDGKGGCLEIVESLGGRYQDWAKVTPRHNEFIQTILQINCHVITSVRRKQDYDMVKNDNGKFSVQKVGMKEVTRDGFEYELTVNFEFLNDKHFVKAGKDRTGLFADKPEHVITKETGKKLIDWANTGFDEIKDIVLKIELADSRDILDAIWKENTSLHKNVQIIEAFKKACVNYPKVSKEVL